MKKCFGGFMKHLVYVFALALTLLFVACGDDDSSSFVSPEKETSSSIAESSSERSGGNPSSPSSSAKSSSSVSSSSSKKSSSSGGLSSSSFPELLCDEEDEGITSWMSGLGDLICKDGYYVPYTRPSSSSQAIPTFKESFEVDSVFASVDKEKEYGLFTDPRDGQVYKTVKIKFGYDGADSITVFAQNLNYGKQIKLETTEFDDNKVEKYCYDDDPWYCDTYFGGLYSWSEAMGFPKACDSVLTGSTPDCPEPLATGLKYQQDSLIIKRQGICPDDWHVMNEDEWRAMIAGEETCTNVVSKAFRGINATGFSALLGGAAFVSVQRFDYMDEFGDFKQPRERDSVTSFVIMMDKMDYWYNQNSRKVDGGSVRCVKNY
jgi:uncharacterized protein (TIGR02145 family)